MAVLWALTLAHAATDIVLVEGEAGGWEGRVVVPAPIEAVAAVLADPVASARFSPDLEATTYVTRGDCDVLRAVTAGVIATSYDYRRCPTGRGWRETLVASPVLSAYEVEWRLVSGAGGTQVVYAVRIETRIPTPAALMDRQVKAAIVTVLGGLRDAAGGGA